METKPTKLDMQSVDGRRMNLEALYEIAPSCFTEAKDKETGALRHVVNFNTLKQLLGDDAVEGGEMYQFTWPGKQEARIEAARPINKTLRPVKEDSVDWDTTENLYIEGDNLEALKLLQKSYMGKVKMIYIDPPYNTGNDFVYDDDFVHTQHNEELANGNIDALGNRFRKNLETNGKFHSDWCSMIYPRLMLARTLLKEDGVIFISIDDSEQENLKKICDEIFGGCNFIAQVIWEKSYAPINLKKHFSENHDYILCYARNKELVKCNGLPRKDETNAKYSNPDNDPRGLWRTDNLSVGPAIESKVYEIITPSGRRCMPPKGRCWLYTKERFQEMLDDNRIWFGENGDNIPAPKRFLSEVKQTMTPLTIWKYTEVGHTQDSMRELKALFDGDKIFDYSKPVKLIKQVIELYSNIDSIVLDFFSGSATTAHATMQLNAEDGGHRKFIMVQLPEVTAEDSEARKAGYKNICDIGKERIRRAGKKIKEEHADKEGIEDLDTGFRVFRIDSSNFNEVALSPNELQQSQLDMLLDNVKSDRTDLDLLFGAMLNWGVQLSLPMESEEVDGKTIYTVNEGDLVACFADEITEDVVKAIADNMPLRVLFRDSCFERDDAKINIFESLKQLLDWSEEDAMKNIKVI